MPATLANIARYTQDGVALTYRDDALKAAQPGALDAGEIPTFCRYRADALALLNERATLQATVGGFHEAIEVDETLGIGTTVPVAPSVPSFRAVDDRRGVNTIGRTRSASFDMGVDRYSVELVG